jgi:hypothetical protein
MTRPVPKSGQLWDSTFGARSPLFVPFEGLTQTWATSPSWPTLHEYTALVERQREQYAPELPKLVFEAMSPRSRRWRRHSVALDQLYDGSIALSGKVPCLPASYHDLFNVVMFAAFPRSKRALHARQFRALSNWIPQDATRLPSRRTREQDALTVFDEGGSVLVLTKAAYQRWQASEQGLELLPHSSDLTALLFGHALMEHIFYGRLQVRSCAVVVLAPEGLPRDSSLLPWVDERLAERLLDESTFTAPGADAVVCFDSDGGERVEARNVVKLSVPPDDHVADQF